MQLDISIWCLIATFVLIYVPRLPALQGTLRQEGHIDLGHPRIQQARLVGMGARAQAAHLNTVEAFAPFAAAVWVAHHYGVDAGTRDLLAVAFVAARVLFILAYLADLNPWRTVIWSVGHLFVALLFLSPLF
jgi:uncharacterized MAPEG superfamily protein